jgi:acetyltransferase
MIVSQNNPHRIRQDRRFINLAGMENTAIEAADLANKIGYPVVMKIHSPDITHKTDVGGVILNIKDEDGVWNNFKNMTRSIKEKMPAAKIEGVTIQPMVNIKDSLEMILGIKKDPIFGTVLLAGMGGTGRNARGTRFLGQVII